MHVHRRMAPGPLKSVYQRCLCHELSRGEIPFRQQVRLPIHNDDIEMEAGYLADIIVRREVILALKAVEQFRPPHEARLLTQLRLRTCRAGLPTDGIRRCIL